MTPAIVLLTKKKLPHRVHQYSHDPSVESYGQEAADALSLSASKIFKTLVVSLNNSANPALGVAIVPVNRQLSLKRAAKAFNCKKVSMADADLVMRTTGYVLGGVSPVAQKKPLMTVIDGSAEHQSSILVSAGKRGVEIELAPADLAKITNAKFFQIADGE